MSPLTSSAEWVPKGMSPGQVSFVQRDRSMGIKSTMNYPRALG